MNHIIVYKKVLFLSIILLIGLSYSMYSDVLRINTYIYMDKPDIDIESYRGFVIKHCCCCTVEVCKGMDDDKITLSSDNNTISLTSMNSSFWLGMVAKNNGEIPVKIYRVSLNSTILLNYTVKHYIYGPYKTGPLYPWGHICCKDLPYPGYNDTVVLDPGYKIVLWIGVDTSTNQTYDVDISIQYSNWNQMN